MMRQQQCRVATHISLATCLALLASCSDDPLVTRHALRPAIEQMADRADRIEYLDQGWTPIESALFYTANQGSRLAPYDWFLSLEQSNSRELFRDNRNLDRLRFLIRSPSPLNPDGLPVGFVRDPADEDEDGDWLGLTCAACHTSQINYQTVGYRIDGGPGQGDIQSLLLDLTAALQQTHDDDEKFQRFASQVLGPCANDFQSKTKLRKRLGDVTVHRQRFDDRNATQHKYGYARVDAFGIILNEVLQNALNTPDDANRQSPDAPVSYPFLWDTPQHDVVQWNGAAPNRLLGTHKLGPLARNVGEVLGVFGTVKVQPSGMDTHYPSSVRLLNLVVIEDLLHKLQSPVWPDRFPSIKADLKVGGEKLFATHCAECHHAIQRANPYREIKAVITPLAAIATDPKMATNFVNRKAKTGPLRGRPFSPLDAQTFGDEADGRDVLKHVVAGVIAGNASLRSRHPGELLRLLEKTKAWNELPIFQPPEPGYKGRPLNGIWATAPYLHNGSVPNLYELLLPATERSDRFYIGRREFDPQKVGFLTDAAPGAFLFRVKDDHGQPIPGNSNLGHEYGTVARDGKPALTEEQRWQLIEYLKSL